MKTNILLQKLGFLALTLLTSQLVNSQTYGKPVIASTSKYYSTATIHNNIEYKISNNAIIALENGKKINSSDPNITIEGKNFYIKKLYFIDNEIHALVHEGSFLHETWKIYRLVFDKDLKLKGQPKLVTNGQVGDKYGIPLKGNKSSYIRFSERYNMNSANQRYLFESTNELLDNLKKDSYAYFHILDDEGKIVSQQGISTKGESVIRQFKPLCIFDDGSAFISYMEGKIITSNYGNYPTFNSQALLYLPTDENKPELIKELQYTPLYPKIASQIILAKKNNEGEHTIIGYSLDDKKAAFNVLKFNPEKGTVNEQEIRIPENIDYNFQSTYIRTHRQLSNGNIALFIGKRQYNVESNLCVLIVNEEGEIVNATPILFTVNSLDHFTRFITYEDENGNPHIILNAMPENISNKLFINKATKLNERNCIQADVLIDLSNDKYSVQPLKRPSNLTGAIYFSDYTTLGPDKYQFKAFIDGRYQFIDVQF